jgi:alcohol dehydrogenase class IV
MRFAAKGFACGEVFAAAYHNGNVSAREGMALASLFGGMALANAALGAVHGFAGPLGGMLNAPHGAICAKLLPLVMDANLEALESRHAGHAAIERYDEIAQLLTGIRTCFCVGWRAVGECVGAAS